jgi:hypothetical protein
MISESENIRLIAQMGAERERASHRSKICRLVERVGMFALCQKRKLCGAARFPLFDHLVSKIEEAFGDSQV